MDTYIFVLTAQDFRPTPYDLLSQKSLIPISEVVRFTKLEFFHVIDVWVDIIYCILKFTIEFLLQKKNAKKMSYFK